MKVFDGDFDKFFNEDFDKFFSGFGFSNTSGSSSFSHSYSSSTSTTTTSNGSTTSSSMTSSEKSFDYTLGKSFGNKVDSISLSYGKNTTGSYDEENTVGTVSRDLGVDLERKANFVPGTYTPMLYCFEKGTLHKLAEIPLAIGHTDAHIPESVTECDLFINDSNNQTQFALKNKTIV